MRLRSRPALFILTTFALTAAACAPELEPFEQRRSARMSLGAEVYKAVCRRIAGSDIPQDVSGQQSEALCMGPPEMVRAAAASERANLALPRDEKRYMGRLVALAERRDAIVQAVDEIFPGYNTPQDTSEDFEQLFRQLVPLYDPPGEHVQNATRTLAAVLERLLDDTMIAGLAKVGREGMATREGSLGMVRATLGASHTNDVGRSLLPLVDGPAVDATVKPHFDTMLRGLGLELATSEVTPETSEDARKLKQLVLRTAPEFSTGKPLYAPLRDARGLPIPTSNGEEAVPFPFVDADGDRFADADGPRFSPHAAFRGKIPDPFPVIRESGVARDAFGRAQALTPSGVDARRAMYQTTDVDTTLLAGMLRAVRKLLENPDLANSTGHVLSALVGEHVPTSERFGAYNLAYSAPNPAASPLLDLVHGSSALVDRPVFDRSVELTRRLLEQHENLLVASLEPLLKLEKRTRPDADAYPGAELKPGHTLWDELLYETEKLSRRRNDATGETLLEAMVRGALGYGRNLKKEGAPIELIVDPEILRHQGAVLATLMRFKDEWRANPKGESERDPSEPLVLGSFRTPVDRSKPDTPVTCGRDGCGGLIEGTPFERWKQPNQQCQFQRAGRPIAGKDCGAPANQSLMQRSMGLIAEMAGRSQCNKPVTIRDLLDFVVKSPCTGVDGAPRPETPECAILERAQREDRANSVRDAETAVAKDYACRGGACDAYKDKYPATFVDRDGVNTGEPATILACHMLEIPDVGRSFGEAVTGQFRLQFPNPWVFRYLEDIALADGTLPACTPEGGFPNYPIQDPLVRPGCTPEAASLSRTLYESDPADAARLRNVHTLADLVEFLLDDTKLFGTDPADREALRPNVKSLSRVLFAPAGSTSFVIFDPLLVRGAPESCAAKPGLPACADDDTAVTPPGGCCIADPKLPPFRYRLDTYYGATSFAWEQPLKLTNGREISFLDTMKSVSDAVARFDYVAGRDDPKNFEETGYVFSVIGKIIAEHWDSPDNPAIQSTHPSGANYRRGTGIVRYETLLADAVDDGTIDRAQLATDGKPLFAPEQTFTPDQQLGLVYHSMPMLQELDRMELAPGVDGIDVSSEITEQLLNPHARCAPADGDRRVIAGEGACDRALRNEPGFSPPFRYRDGRNHVCWEDKRCFDGMANKPRHFAAPLYVIADALSAVDEAVRVDPARDRSLRKMIGGLADAYGTTQNGRLADRNVRQLLLALMQHSLEQVAEERQKGTLATLLQRTDEDMAELLHSPVVAGGLGLFGSLYGKGTALTDMSRYGASMLSETPDQNNLRPLLTGLFDLVQLLPGTNETNASLKGLASAFADDVNAAVAGQPAMLDVQKSAVGRNLFMLRETASKDTNNVTERVLKNMARLPADGRPSPIDVILEAVMQVLRPEPSDEGTPTTNDLKAVLGQIAKTMRDEERGFERLYKIMLCSRHGQEREGCE